MLPPHRNPIFYREWCVATRPGKLVGTAVTMVLLLALLLLYLVANAAGGRGGDLSALHWAEVLRHYGAAILIVQFFIAFYAALGCSLDCLGAEHLRKSYEFLVTLPISSVDKVLGLAIGTNILPLMICLALTPLAVLSCLAGGVRGETLLWVYAIATVGFLSSAFVGVAASNVLGKGRAGWIITLLILGISLPGLGIVYEESFRALPFLTFSPFGILAALLGLGDASDLARVLQPGQYHFYGWVVPWQICPLAFYAFLAVVGFCAAAWGMYKIDTAPMPRVFPIASYGVLHVLLVGFLADAFGGDGDDALEMAAAYLLCFFVLVLAWSFFSTRNYQGLMPWVEKRPHWSLRLLRDSLGDTGAPPAIVLVLLWAITLAALVAADSLYWQGLLAARLVKGGAILGVFLLAYYCIYLTGKLTARRGGGMLGLLLIIGAFGVPLIFSTLRGLDNLAMATPIGLFFDGNLLRCDRYDRVRDSQVMQSTLWAGGLLVASALLAASRLEALRRLAPQSRRNRPVPAARP